jgi:hypothetical protein
MTPSLNSADATGLRSRRSAYTKLLVELKEDPEADARVQAWFARDVRPLGT